MNRRMTDRLRNEKGIALVAALCISAILLIFAIALTYRMATYLRMLATSKEKNQTYYTALTGISQLSDSLRIGNCLPPNWCGRLGYAGYPLKADYQDLTQFATGTASPATFPYTADTYETRSSYTVLLKDNDEFDNDYTSDSDQLIMAVVTSTGQNETRTSVEAGLLYDAEAECTYKQAGQCSSRSGKTKDTNLNAAAGVRNAKVGG